MVPSADWRARFIKPIRRYRIGTRVLLMRAPTYSGRVPVAPTEAIATRRNTGDAYEALFLRSLTLRAQDKACPGRKEDSL
jgi:hypothetical protein